MSPPDTKVEKQARRHRPALIGIIVALVLVLVLWLVVPFFGSDPEAPAEEEGAAATQ